MAITLALAAALGYAVASVLQHRAAAAVPRAFSMRIGLLTRLLSRPLWLLGVGVDLSAFCFEAWALAVGSLAVVQPVLVLGLPVALVLGAVVARERFGRREALGSVAVCGGLVMFLTVSTPSRGHELAAAGRWVVVVVVLGISVAACLIAAARQSRWRAACLGTATGLVFAVSAALTKSSASLVRRVGIGAAGHWEIYALAAVAGFSMLLAQSAFQAGSLSESLPAITLVPPFASAAIGVFLFGERIGGSPFAVAVAVASAALAVSGVVVLARSPLAESAYSASASAEAAPGPGAADSAPDRNMAG